VAIIRGDFLSLSQENPHSDQVNFPYPDFPQARPARFSENVEPPTYGEIAS
jgi:hypothetical protein